MKLSILSAALAVTALSGFASADVYTDATGDMFDNGLTHLDMTAVEVTNTLTDISFKISVVADPITTPDWGKYQVGIDTNPATGDTSANGNPWNRRVSMSGGMDAWLGSWVDSGGGVQPWTHAAGAWTQNGQFPVVISGNSTTLTVPLASLGLIPGQTFLFDVYATGGGNDGANDALSVSGIASSNWDVNFQTQGGLSYTVAIPEPTTLGLLAGASVLGLRRRK